MSSQKIALIVFACVFGSAMLGFLLSGKRREGYLDNNSRDVVKLSTGLIATLSALVLGLLVSSAKETFDQVNKEMMQMAVKAVLLDRTLAQFGPETREIRVLIKNGY